MFRLYSSKVTSILSRSVIAFWGSAGMILRSCKLIKGEMLRPFEYQFWRRALLALKVEVIPPPPFLWQILFTWIAVEGYTAGHRQNYYQMLVAQCPEERSTRLLEDYSALPPPRMIISLGTAGLSGFVSRPCHKSIDFHRTRRPSSRPSLKT